MDSASIYKTIRQTVLFCLPGARVLLFGSRARGDADGLSDYDLLIITPATFTPQEKVRLSTCIDNAITKTLKIPVDLLLNSEEEIVQKQLLPGHIVRSAMREGIAI